MTTAPIPRALIPPAEAARRRSAPRRAPAPARTRHHARLAACRHTAAVGFDLVSRGATVVTPGHREAADIGIADGRIAQLGSPMTGTRKPGGLPPLGEPC
jgi:hypothetical protein